MGIAVSSFRLAANPCKRPFRVGVAFDFVTGPTIRRRRHAMTIVETAVVITVMGLLLGLITSVAIRIVRAESMTRNHHAQLYAWSQLASQFRADIHGATIVILPSEANGLTLRIDPETDRAVEYTVEPGQVHRTVGTSAAVSSRNAFRVPDEATAVFATFSIEDVIFARIRVQENQAARNLFECTAQVNRDHRYGERIQP